MTSTLRFLATLLLGIAAVLLLSCAASSKAARDYTTAPGERTCFNSHNARSFSPLHERFIYVRVRSDEHYLLTLDRVCLGLRSATGIAITDDFSRVCSDSRARITYRDGTGQKTCRIVGVEAVRDRGEAEEIVKTRTTPAPLPR